MKLVPGRNISCSDTYCSTAMSFVWSLPAQRVNITTTIIIIIIIIITTIAHFKTEFIVI